MIDFAPWDYLLKHYVDDHGRVDYARWQAESATQLDQWLADHRDVEWPSLDRATAIAFLINLYNALTIRQVLHKYPLRSIRPQILGIPNWIAFLRFFTQKLYTLNGERVSLNGIEHDILRSRYPEPRIHFALVCASVGCPLLRSGAYWPDQLEAQLEAEAQRFIQNPDKVRYEGDCRTLYCSKIFKWYRADFLTVADTVPAYIQRYLPNVNIPADVAIAYLPYSWQLNQRTSS